MGKKLGLKHIEAIHAVILTGSVTGAAGRLHVTQPAISNVLRDAEERLGFALFDRRGGRVMPTPLADQLFEEIERSFTGLDAINTFCEQIHGSQRRHLRVACTPVFGATVFPHIARHSGATAYDTYYSVRSAPAHHVAALVSSRKIDIGFALDVPPLPGVDSAVLAEVPLYCYLPAGHALCQRPAITVADLQGLPMISLSRMEGVDDIVERTFAQAGQGLFTVAECPAAITACAMVAAGMGFMLFDIFPSLLFDPARVVVRPFQSTDRLIYKAYWLHGRSEFAHEPLVAAARLAIQEALAQRNRAAA